jgi:7,8-dihydroneopterin aldolase/epimerase/oxygenase
MPGNKSKKNSIPISLVLKDYFCCCRDIFNMAQLVLHNMEFYAHHGHFDEEQIIGGRFRVDMVIDTDISRAAETDNLNDAVDYSLVYHAVKHEMETPSKLLEHLARRVVDAVYGVSDRIEKVTVTVSKLNPAIGGHMDKFSVVLTR